MRAAELVWKKRDGLPLSGAEMRGLIWGFLKGEVPDYQISAWLMAVFFRGMTEEELLEYTLCLAESGERLDLRRLGITAADKHSTGGVGDKTTLVAAPMVAAAGVPVAKMAGRGLGHTGGTLDKLESIPGVKTSLAPQEFCLLVERLGLAIAGQSPAMVPADGKIYALRDVTATVDSIPLIAASVMSKKLAGGAAAVVLDVKQGSGAFMKTEEGAMELAHVMVRIGIRAGLRTVAFITRMDQPLGRAVGNALEVREAIEALKGHGPQDLLELSLALGTRMITEAQPGTGPAEARARLLRALESGAALEKLGQLVEALGGPRRVVEEPSMLPAAMYTYTLPSPRGGYIGAIDALGVGRGAALLGAGRARKGDPLDPSAGVVLHAKRGERVEAGQPIMNVYANDEAKAHATLELLRGTVVIADEPPHCDPLVISEVQA